ncbi:LacI family DNA-binding transcriptional regulator [Litoribacter ruber]|uniref:LacI family DNA-binding transcriptional regulator n=1 Tax=Litoribacter ruber TaxID=702568 RepID=A0AAP2G5T4_9BACT|nr:MULTISPECIES: LacI family DNA-binding transcriptional regulator [Litoribacter]MBS9524903.1 LacI family DNA-binding transcriptional regulator [Litoribacter alkaliphilus]MBT0811936.1 LacI family DNA-binding transcriptional regulator [Litoribacter ruber]
MAKKKYSIKDIANELNISITTVSFILNGKAKENRISEKLTKKVLDYVKKVGYKPNQLAQSLRTGKSKIIVFMVEDISNPFFSNIARNIESKAHENDYKIIYCSTDNKKEKAQELIRLFKGRHVDGYIITPTEGMEEDINMLLSEKIPVVLFDRYFPEVETSYVGINNYQAAKDANNYLIGKGYKNIGLVTLKSAQTQMTDRMDGYLDALIESDLRPVVKEVDYDNFNSDGIIRDIEKFIVTNDQLDAIFFTTNYLTISGLKAIKRLKRSIPEDLAIVAFDDNVLFSLFDPPITALVQPIEDLSKNLMEIILPQLKGNMDIVKKELPATLLKRASTN